MVPAPPTVLRANKCWKTAVFQAHSSLQELHTVTISGSEKRNVLYIPFLITFMLGGTRDTGSNCPFYTTPHSTPTLETESHYTSCTPHLKFCIVRVIQNYLPPPPSSFSFCDNLTLLYALHGHLWFIFVDGKHINTYMNTQIGVTKK